MGTQTSEQMAKTRALITETEREQLRGEHGKERKYQAATRIRNRIEEELPRDIENLVKNHPDFLKEI